MDKNACGSMNKLYSHKRKMLTEGRSFIDLSMINPDFPPPSSLLDRLLEATHKPEFHKYSVSQGIKRLRDAFCFKYKNCFEVYLESDSEVCVTFGSKDAVLQALSASTSPGDTILLGSPGYPAHLYAAEHCGLNTVFFEVSADEDAMLDSIEQQLVAHKVKVLLLNFPHNPTGLVVTRRFYERLGSLKALSSECLLVNDYVYGEMAFPGKTPPVSILSVPLCAHARPAVETYSLSKAYSVPGWRVGALLGNAQMLRKVGRLKSRLDFGLFLPIQIAAVNALNSSDDLVSAAVCGYQRRWHILSQGLQDRGWTVVESHAGCSLWAKAPPQHTHSLDFCLTLLDHGVAALPGDSFGEKFGNGWVRFALVESDAVLRDALSRIGSVKAIEKESYAMQIGGS